MQNLLRSTSVSAIGNLTRIKMAANIYSIDGLHDVHIRNGAAFTEMAFTPHLFPFFTRLLAMHYDRPRSSI